MNKIQIGDKVFIIDFLMSSILEQQPRESGSRSDFISRVQNNIVLIEAEY
jgi:hypothetical protein